MKTWTKFLLLLFSVFGFEWDGLRERILFHLFFKGKDNLIELIRFVSLYIGREYDGREFTVIVLVPVTRGKKQEYMIEVDDDISCQYVIGFGRKGEVDNLRIYSALKSKPNGLLGEDVHR